MLIVLKMENQSKDVDWSKNVKAVKFGDDDVAEES